VWHKYQVSYCFHPNAPGPRGDVGVCLLTSAVPNRNKGINGIEIDPKGVGFPEYWGFVLTVKLFLTGMRPFSLQHGVIPPSAVLTSHRLLF
jgi:hypothetical protein